MPRRFCSILLLLAAIAAARPSAAADGSAQPDDAKLIAQLSAAVAKGDVPTAAKTLDAFLKTERSPEERQAAYGRAVAQISPQLQSPQPNVQLIAATVAYRLGEPLRAGPVLVTLLDTRDRGIRVTAAGVLGELPEFAAKSAPELLKLVDESDSQVATQATNSLILLGRTSPHAVELLAKRFAGADRRTRRNLAFIVASIGPPAKIAAPALSAIVDDKTEEPAVRLAAATARWNIAGDDTGALALAITALDDPNAPVRRQAIVLLQLIGAGKLEAVKPLIKSLEDSDAAVRDGAAYALGKVGEPALAPLIAALGNESARVRASAAFALGEMQSGAKAAVPRLIDNMADDDQSVRLETVSALGAIGPEAKAAITLVKLVRNDKHKPIRWTASVALWKITGKPETAVEAGIEAIDDEAAPIEDRLAMVGILTELGPAAAPALPQLIKLLADKTARSRYFAARAIGAIGPAANAAVPALQKLKEDPEPPVRDEAARAIALIEASTPMPPDSTSREAAPAM